MLLFTTHLAGLIWEMWAYNSWGVVARLKSRLGLEPLQFWDWLPGVLIVDTSVRFTLPNPMLAAYAGTEWADNDYRIFCGFADVDWYLTMQTSFIEQMKRLTGPGWAGWPYGVRQLHEALVGWIKPGAELPEIVLLASVRQSGSKITALDPRLYNPGPTLGAWNSAPATWDCRQAARFLYHAKLMIGDGLPEMAVTTAISALENAIAEVLRFKLADPNKADAPLRRTKFLSRFKKLLPQYGVTLPKSLAKPIKPAYLARNEIVHGASAIRVESAAEHVANPESPMRSGLGVGTRGEGRGMRRSALDSDKWGRWRPLVVVGGADGGPGQRRWGGVGGTACRGRQSRTGPMRLYGAVG